MTTLNARANQAWHEAVDGTTEEPYDGIPRDAFEDGWEAGYKAACAEQDNRLDVVQARAYEAGWNNAKEDGKL